MTTIVKNLSENEIISAIKVKINACSNIKSLSSALFGAWTMAKAKQESLNQPINS